MNLNREKDAHDCKTCPQNRLKRDGAQDFNQKANPCDGRGSRAGAHCCDTQGARRSLSRCGVRVDASHALGVAGGDHLSAQCTDVRVNMVTPELFKRFPTPAGMAKAKLPELENLIRTTGFFHNKAKSIQGAAKRITEEFGGKVPETLAELITVPGAARKTANVVLGVSFGKAEGVVVDTHVFRIAHRLGLTKSDTAEKVEQDLMHILPQDRWISFSHQVIHHGRQVCIARNPKCDKCNLESFATPKTRHGAVNGSQF